MKSERGIYGSLGGCLHDRYGDQLFVIYFSFALALRYQRTMLRDTGEVPPSPRLPQKNGDVPRSPLSFNRQRLCHRWACPIDSLVCAGRLRPCRAHSRAACSGFPEPIKQVMENIMNRRHVFTLSVIPMLALILPGAAGAQQKTLKEQLAGTWTAVSWEQIGKDGWQ